MADRIVYALCIKRMKLTAKYFFLADIYFGGVILDVDKYIFPWQTCFLGVSSKLQLSCIRIMQYRLFTDNEFISYDTFISRYILDTTCEVYLIT